MRASARIAGEVVPSAAFEEKMDRCAAAALRAVKPGSPSATGWRWRIAGAGRPA
jgi:hypothetical protein